MTRFVLSVFLFGLLGTSPPASAYEIPYCDDWLVVESTADVVTVTHMGAQYNCCPDHWDYDVALVDDRIEIVETEVLPPDICLCHCCWNTTVEVFDVPPGRWTVRLEYFDEETQEWAVLHGTVDVSGAGQGAAFAVSGVWDSGCLEIGTPVADGLETSSWGRIKELMR